MSTLNIAIEILDMIILAPILIILAKMLYESGTSTLDLSKTARVLHAVGISFIVVVILKKLARLLHLNLFFPVLLLPVL
jgi:hypothetical protein